jgi:hypothetical protein
MNAHLQPVLRIVMLMLFGACAFLLPAQEIDIQSNDDKPIEERIVYSRQNMTHIAIHSQGFALGFRIGRIRTINRTTNWEVEAASLHALKEIKTINVSTYNTRPYIYGKLNNAYVLRVGYGEDQRIFGKPYWGGVETRWSFEAGASLALLKPYYYYVLVYHPTSTGYDEIIEEQTFDQKDQWVDILGKAPFTKGLGQTKFSPGAHASVGISFEFGKSRTRVRSINVKAVAEGFPLGAPIMDGQRNKWFYLTLHLSYNWGSRFNKY